MATRMLETPRLNLNQLSYDDCEFILELVNEPPFIRFIGDKGVRNVEDARAYLADGPIGSYEKSGFGLYRVSRRDKDWPLGICGLVQREEYKDPDLGFAFLERHWSNGYAEESSAAVLDYSKNALGLSRVIAMADKENYSSIRLLDKLGFSYQRMIRMSGDSKDVCQYAIDVRSI